MASADGVHGDADNDIDATLPSHYESCEAIIRCDPGLRFPENDDCVEWERGDIVCSLQTVLKWSTCLRTAFEQTTTEPDEPIVFIVPYGRRTCETIFKLVEHDSADIAELLASLGVGFLSEILEAIDFLRMPTLERTIACAIENITADRNFQQLREYLESKGGDEVGDEDNTDEGEEGDEQTSKCVIQRRESHEANLQGHSSFWSS